jgi:hypothetical protein
VKFVRSLTVARSEIIEFLRLWELSQDPRAPFESLILTPLPGLTDPSRVSTVKQYFAHHSHIIFDSGGYAVQQGIISYEDLYQRLLSYSMFALLERGVAGKDTMWYQGEE